MNKIFLSGNLTRELELRYTHSGKAYVRNAIAVNRPFSKDKEVDFFNLLAWNQTAEFLSKYFSKGSKVLVEGRLQNSKYKDKDGNERTATDIIVEGVDFADGNKKSAPAPEGFEGSLVDPDDTPFLGVVGKVRKKKNTSNSLIK